MNLRTGQEQEIARPLYNGLNAQAYISVFDVSPNGEAVILGYAADYSSGDVTLIRSLTDPNSRLDITGKLLEATFDAAAGTVSLRLQRNSEEKTLGVNLKSMKFLSVSGWIMAASNPSWAFRPTMSGGNITKLELQDIRTGMIQTVAQGSVGANYDVAPDGSTVLYSQYNYPVGYQTVIQRINNPGQKLILDNYLLSVRYEGGVAVIVAITDLGYVVTYHVNLSTLQIQP